MAPTFAAVLFLLASVEAIRSDDSTNHDSGGIVDAAAALVCSLGFKFEYPEALLPDEDHPCCAAAKTCELNEATETCATKCKAKIMNWADSDIWLPESCVSPADATPETESFKAFKVKEKAVPNAKAKEFEGKKLTAENEKIKITC